MPQINMPREKKDAIERALTAAQGIFSIYSQIKNNNRADSEAQQNQKIKDAQLSALQDQASGVITKKDLLDKADKVITVPEGTKGAQTYAVRTAPGQTEPVFILPKQSNDSALDSFIKKLTVQKNLLDIEAKNRPTPDQSKAATFAKRVEQAEGVFNNLKDNGYDATQLGNQIQGSSLYPEMFKSGDAKQQQQAERNFVNAILRRESGSAISSQEFDSAEKQYFPRAGDTSEVLDQKAENRRIALEGLKSEAGKGYSKLESALAQGGNPAKKVPPGMVRGKIQTAGFGGGSDGIDLSKMTREQKIKFLQGQ